MSSAVYKIKKQIEIKNLELDVLRGRFDRAQDNDATNQINICLSISLTLAEMHALNELLKQFTDEK